MCDDPGPLPRLSAWLRVRLAPLLDLDEAHYLREVRRALELSGRPYPENRVDRRVFDVETASPPWYAYFSRMALPAFGMVLERSEVHAARLDLARLALALRIHRIRHGALPERLDDLERDVLPEAPVDPFSGGPCFYQRLDPTRFALRSVGPDGEDDGGKDDDIVWGAKE